MREVTTGVWHWEAPHPEWRHEEWDYKDVSSYAIDDGERLLLFDPLAVPDEILELAAERIVPTQGPPTDRDALEKALDA